MSRLRLALAHTAAVDIEPHLVLRAGPRRTQLATLNHTVWFHRPIKFDDWVLYSTTSPVAADSRGLASGHFFDRAGQVLATVTQEGIVKHFPG